MKAIDKFVFLLIEIFVYNHSAIIINLLAYTTWEFTPAQLLPS